MATGFILIVLLVFLFQSKKEEMNIKEPTVAPKADEVLISEALAAKYQLQVEQITNLKIEQNNGNFAKGSANVGSEGPGTGGVFFAAKQNGSWVIVVDGNGIPECKPFDTYNFPKEMYGGCIENGELRRN